jgi:hypothetical protein
MPFLKEEELATYYPKAANMDEGEKKLYLQRANSFAFGIIGGLPPFTPQLPEDQLKVAVALAFEILAKDETAQIDDVNGNITEAAPTGYFQRREKDPLEHVKTMLLPYAAAYDQVNTTKSERGIMFI